MPNPGRFALSLLTGTLLACLVGGCERPSALVVPEAKNPAEGDLHALRRSILSMKQLAESGQLDELRRAYTYRPANLRSDEPSRESRTLSDPRRALQLAASFMVFLSREPRWLSSAIACYDLSDVEDRDVPRQAYFVLWRGVWRLLNSAGDLDAFRTEVAAHDATLGSHRR